MATSHTGTTRDERERRIEADDGDPDDEVYVTVTPDTAGNRNNQGDIYHDDENCRYLRGETGTKTRQRAHDQWQAPCKNCIVPNFEA